MSTFKSFFLVFTSVSSREIGRPGWIGYRPQYKKCAKEKRVHTWAHQHYHIRTYKQAVASVHAYRKLRKTQDVSPSNDWCIWQLFPTGDSIALKAVNIPGPAESLKTDTFHNTVCWIGLFCFYLFSLGAGSSVVMFSCGLFPTSWLSVFHIKDFAVFSTVNPDFSSFFSLMCHILKPSAFTNCEDDLLLVTFTAPGVFSPTNIFQSQGSRRFLQRFLPKSPISCFYYILHFYCQSVACSTHIAQK